MSHVPVLLEEVVEYLNAKKAGPASPKMASRGRRFVDATVGGGGHARAIIKANTKNKVLGIDLDQASLDKLDHQFVQESLNQKIQLVQGSYKNIDKLLSDIGWGKVDGIILDLGFSSIQLDDPGRGFSFAADGPLDMRYDSSQGLTAAEVVNRYYPKDLERVIKDFGEEKFARGITAKIINARKIKRFTTTSELAEVIKTAVPLPVRFKANDNIRRVFQGIRIEVNRELENLKAALPKMLAALNPKGRLVVISFHSLEDRIVKEFFKSETKDCVCPPEFPTCICDKAQTLKVLTRKPVMATEIEIQNNPRSKPAKLRAAEKI